MSELLSKEKVLAELRQIQMSPDFQRGRVGGDTHETDLYIERLLLMQRIYDSIFAMKTEPDVWRWKEKKRDYADSALQALRKHI